MPNPHCLVRPAPAAASRRHVADWLFTLLVAFTCWQLSAATANAVEEPREQEQQQDQKQESPQQTPARELEPLTAEAQAAADRLLRELPEPSEARAMLDAILAGSQLDAGEGWFRTSVSQTRFTWDVVARRYDANQDGQVERDEFPGTDADFARLDRSGNQRLDDADLTFSEHALARTPGLMMFYMLDGDGNGKVTREEFQAMFERFDTEQHGYLSLDDLRDRLAPRSSSGNEKQPDEPSRSTLVLGLARQEIGALLPGPSIDDEAPDFTLPSLVGNDVRLKDRLGSRPIVLIFGNFTCGPFRGEAGNLEKLYLRYRDRADFYMVYVREAHPSDGWWMQSNKRVGVETAQPGTLEQRRQIATICRERLELGIPLLVDTIDDRVGAAYSGMPSRLYLIDATGRVAFKSGRGPFGFRPRELEQSLLLLLNTGR